MSSSLLDLYSDYLISSFGQTSATGLSRLTDGVVSHDQVTRFLSEPKKTGADLWPKVKPLVRQLQSPEGVLIFDDTIEEKPYCKALDLLDTDLGVIQRPRRTGLGVFPDAPERAFCSHDAARSTAHYRRA